MGQQASTATPPEIVQQVRTHQKLLSNESDPTGEEAILTLYNIAKEVNDFGCDPISDLHTIQPFSLLGSDQRHNACIVRRYLSRYMSQLTTEGIPIGTEEIRSLFSPFRSVTTSVDSYYGMVAEAGLKGASDDSAFMMIKYAYKANPLPLIIEFVVGLLVNRLRYKLPNIMFTYAGLYCSPPLEVHRAMRGVYDAVLHSYMKQLQVQIQQHGLGSIATNRLTSRLKDRLGRLLRGSSEEVRKICHNNTSWIQWIREKFLSPLVEQHREKAKILTSLVSEEKDIQQWSKWIHAIQRESLWTNQLRTQFIQAYNRFHTLKQESKDFDPELLCSANQSKSLLLLTEKIPVYSDLRSLMEMSKPKQEVEMQITETDLIAIWLQLISALNVGWMDMELVHNDLHGGNILIRKQEAPYDFRYDLQIGETDRCELRFQSSYIAVIIDFGLASVLYKGKRVGKSKDRALPRNTDDLLKLHQNFKHLARKGFTVLDKLLQMGNQVLLGNVESRVIWTYYSLFLKIASTRVTTSID
jgi:serine/threonine protein kinase